MNHPQTIDGIALHRLLESGYRNLKKNTATINALNVFPVPDGDTGTNMVRTFGGGFLAAAPDSRVGAYMDALSRGCLLSARGNSGVIFSQFIHGLARGFAGKDTVCFGDFAHAFACAREDAYNAILTPTEGTILTVISEAAAFLQDRGQEFADFPRGFAALLGQMKQTLAHTPELLPILKESGVVDSGGAGLVCFIEGICACLEGKTVEDTPDLADTLSPAATGTFGPDSVLEYGYCTEFILQLMNAKTDISAFRLDRFLEPLQEMGDSIVAVVSDTLVKLHIHTFTPERVLEYGRRFGEFVTLKIENMSVQHSQTPEAPQSQPEKLRCKYAVVAVASGKGIADYFTQIGAGAVIDGGQTSNPPVEAFLQTFRGFEAEYIIVLPNNSNVVLTAQQAAELYTDAQVRVIPTKSVVEGCSALSLFNPGCADIDTLLEEMSCGLDGVTTGYLTTAIRDAVIGGVQVRKGHYIGLDRETILSCGEDKVQTAFELVQAITRRAPKEIIIVFCGADASESEAQAFQRLLEAAYPMAEIGFLPGGQEIYDFIISLE